MTAFFKKGMMSETNAVALSVVSAVVGTLWFLAARDTITPLRLVGATAAVLYGHRRLAGGPSCFDVAKLKGTRMTGKVVIVTGANSGIGYYTALRLAELGAKVVITCRTEAMVKETAARMRLEFRGRKESMYRSKGRWCAENLDIVEGFSLTCDDFESVRRFVAAFLATNLPLHVLVNNAGMMVRPLQYSTHNPDLELHTAVNFFGPVLLTELLVETLKKSGGRVVHVASEAHRMGELVFKTGDSAFIVESLKQINRGASRAAGPLSDRGSLTTSFVRYGFSKLCNVYYAHYCASVHKIPSCSLHPGCVATGFSRNLLFDWVKTIFDRASLLYLKKSEEGAETTIYCSICPDHELHPVASSKAGPKAPVIAPYFVDCKLSTESLLKPIGWNIDAAMAVSQWAVDQTKSS